MSFDRQLVPQDAIPEVVRHKWGGAVLREGFVPFPKMLLRVLPGLFDGSNAVEDLAAVLAIVDYRRPQMATPPSSEYLAFLAGMKPDQFDRALRRLQEAKYIVVSGASSALAIDLSGLVRAIRRAALEQDEESWRDDGEI